MSFAANKLYELLPAVYRQRDAQLARETEIRVEEGSGKFDRKTTGPLKALCYVIADQVEILEEDLAQLYDDQFIETCAEWVVPYIADLIGHPIRHSEVPDGVSVRAEVANTIAYRRRKGTPAILEQIARECTGWHVRVMEFFQVIGWTQNMNHVCNERWYAPDMRRLETLRNIGGPFDPVPHTINVRDMRTGEGRYNIKNVGIFLWRLGAYALTRSPAVAVSSHDKRRFRFNPLGVDTQLFVAPLPVGDLSKRAEQINVPSRISRELLRAHLQDYFGQGKSLNIEIGGRNIVEVHKREMEERVEVRDLSGVDTDWKYAPKSGVVAIDPVLGRIAFGDDQDVPPTVSFYYGFSAATGGGEYNRKRSIDWMLQPVTQVDGAIQEALDEVSSNGQGGVVEIPNSNRYEEALTIQAPAGQRVELRGSNQRRPCLVLPRRHVFEITGGPDGVVTLNGLLIGGGTIHVRSSQAKGLRLLRLCHCTLVPGLALNPDASPRFPEVPSLILGIPNLSVEIDHCILGAIHASEVSHLRITDSIVDATAKQRPAVMTIGGGQERIALTMLRSTVFGQVHTHSIELAENCVFNGQVVVANRNTGCVRFCYVSPDSKTPPRYECQPDLVRQAAKKHSGAARETAGTDTHEAERTRPEFDSDHYGFPGYGRLSLKCPREIREGADDEAEMGAFHDLYQPQRLTALTSRLAAYLPFGLQTGTIYVT